MIDWETVYPQMNMTIYCPFRGRLRVSDVVSVLVCLALHHYFVATAMSEVTIVNHQNQATLASPANPF